MSGTRTELVYKSPSGCRFFDGILMTKGLFFGEDLHVFFVANVAATHALKMGSLQLAVDHPASYVFHGLGQRDEGYLAGAGLQGEHALADEATANGYAVETAHELALIPYLHACSQMLTMEFGVGFDHVIAQPGSFFFIAQLAAMTDYTFEIAVDGYFMEVLVE